MEAVGFIIDSGQEAKTEILAKESADVSGNELFTQHMYRYVEAGSHPQQMRSGMPVK